MISRLGSLSIAAPEKLPETATPRMRAAVSASRASLRSTVINSTRSLSRSRTRLWIFPGTRTAACDADMIFPLLARTVGGGRLTDAHFRLDKMDSVRLVTALQSIEKGARRKPSDLRLTIPDRGQRRRRDGRLLEIVI